jgi:hypothetical protein
MRPLPPGYNPGRPRPGMQQPQQPGRQPIGLPRGPIFANSNATPFIINPVRQPGGMGPLPNNFGPMQGVGDPRLGAATIPGNQLQMQMRGPQQAPMQQFSYGGRAGYQMGGIGTLPMDYGQSLQVPQQPQSMFTTTGSATSSPLLNYGQTGIGQAGGTPLTRNSYQEGGLTDFYNNQEPIIPRIENIGGLLDQAEQSIGEPTNNFSSPLASTFSRFGMQEGGMGMMQQPQVPQIDPSQMDPKQALELIIQMLIEQGIPPEQAREIAIQMVQAVAEGGMGEMSDERVEARFGGRIGYASGGIGNLVNREGYFLGSVVKGITGAVKGVVKGVTGAIKKVVSSDLGKAALTIAAIYATGGGFSPQGFSMFGSSAGPGLLGGSGAFDLGSSYLGQGLFGAPTVFAPGTSEIASLGSKGLLGNLGVTSGFGADLFSGGISSLLPSKSTLLTSALGGALGGALAGGMPQQQPGESDAEYQARVDQWKATLQSRLDQPNPQFAQGLYPNNPFYPQRAAEGGRIGYQEGGIGNLIKQVTQQEFFGRPTMAMGGEIPVRQNQVGVQELDYRKTGGFVPPIGIKEKADDIPAMLSNNEFVFTADAVRNAGGGNVNKGAERMYSLMKNLENGGRV